MLPKKEEGVSGVTFLTPEKKNGQTALLLMQQNQNEGH